MNVYDTANRLAKEIQESEEYKSYKKLKDEIMSNPESKKKIEEFEGLRYEVQLMQYTGEKRDARQKDPLYGERAVQSHEYGYEGSVFPGRRQQDCGRGSCKVRSGGYAALF